MAMFDLADSESDASDAQTQFADVRAPIYCNDKATNAAAARSRDKESMHLISQPGKGQTSDRNGWIGERLILEYCCGPHRKVGYSLSFVDRSCKVIRCTVSEDMRTDESKHTALTEIKTLKGNICHSGVRSPAPEDPLGNTEMRFIISVAATTGPSVGSEESEGAPDAYSGTLERLSRCR
eukprot:5023870-Pyramimonas_sp.AAC.1